LSTIERVSFADHPEVGFMAWASRGVRGSVRAPSTGSRRRFETDCRDRLHVLLLRIVGALTAPTSMALTCQWRSRPQHQEETSLELLRPFGASRRIQLSRMAAGAVRRDGAGIG
jgi:hypothetical protein